MVNGTASLRRIVGDICLVESDAATAPSREGGRQSSSDSKTSFLFHLSSEDHQGTVPEMPDKLVFIKTEIERTCKQFAAAA
jgi:hypothetical protein